MKEKVKELLGTGLPNNVVATAVGISESQVTQWMSEESFAADVQELRMKNLTEATQRDSKYNTLEDKVLELMEDKLTNLGLALKPVELSRIMSVLNAAKRRGAPAELNSNSPKTVVPLILPTIIMQKFIVNGHNQVVEVEGRTIATISASKVIKELDDRSKNRDNNVKANSEDIERAAITLDNMRKVLALPVADVLSPLAQEL